VICFSLLNDVQPCLYKNSRKNEYNTNHEAAGELEVEEILCKEESRDASHEE
jgi:hypothetical protein